MSGSLINLDFRIQALCEAVGVGVHGRPNAIEKSMGGGTRTIVILKEGDRENGGEIANGAF